MYNALIEKIKIISIDEDEAFQLFAEIQLGFLEAVTNGPLCHENIFGCIFIIDSMKYVEEEEED